MVLIVEYGGLPRRRRPDRLLEGDGDESSLPPKDGAFALVMVAYPDIGLQ